MALLLLLASCGVNTFLEQRGQKDELKPNKNYWFEMDATRRSGFIINREGGPKVLSEPAPDAILSRDTEIYAKIVEAISSATASETSGEGRLRLIETASELKSRHESVMVLREALYRLSEMTFNGYLDMSPSCDEKTESHNTFLMNVETVLSTPKRAERAARVEQLFRRTLDAIENTFKPTAPASPAAAPKPASLDLARSSKDGGLVLNTTVISASKPELMVALSSRGALRVGIQVTGARVKDGTNDLPATVEANKGPDDYFGIALKANPSSVDFTMKLELLPGVTEVALTLRAGTSAVGDPIRLAVK